MHCFIGISIETNGSMIGCDEQFRTESPCEEWHSYLKKFALHSFPPKRSKLGSNCPIGLIFISYGAKLYRLLSLIHGPSAICFSLHKRIWIEPQEQLYSNISVWKLEWRASWLFSRLWSRARIKPYREGIRGSWNACCSLSSSDHGHVVGATYLLSNLFWRSTYLLSNLHWGVLFWGSILKTIVGSLTGWSQSEFVRSCVRSFVRSFAQLMLFAQLLFTGRFSQMMCLSIRRHK